MKKRMIQQESDLPIELSAPARRALVGAGYLRLEQLTRVSEAELKQLHGVGPKTLKQLRAVFETRGLSFADGKDRSRNGNR
jgi:ERCC4-type nuclease